MGTVSRRRQSALTDRCAWQQCWHEDDFKRTKMGKRIPNPVVFAAKSPLSKDGGYKSIALFLLLATMALGAGSAQAHIAKINNEDGRLLFVNAEPPATLKLTSRKPRGIFLPAQVS